MEAEGECHDPLFDTSVMLAVPAIEPPEDSLSRWKANIARHQKVVMYGVRPPYDAVRDPTPDNDEKLAGGAAIFDRQCSSCHGWSGRGTGARSGGPSQAIALPERGAADPA